MFKLGVAGATIATVISQVVGALIPLVYFARENDTILKYSGKFVNATCKHII